MVRPENPPPARNNEWDEEEKIWANAEALNIAYTLIVLFLLFIFVMVPLIIAERQNWDNCKEKSSLVKCSVCKDNAILVHGQCISSCPD